MVRSGFKTRRHSARSEESSLKYRTSVAAPPLEWHFDFETASSLCTGSTLCGLFMPVTTIQDEGQTLPHPTGKLLGIVDTRESLKSLASGLAAAGFKKIESLAGEDGVALLERVDQFFFSDMEDRVLARHIQELKAGHIIIAIEVPSDRVEEATRIASEHDARRLVYFGRMTITWLTK
jgi:hypothetical protein